MKTHEKVKQIYEHIDKWHVDQTERGMDRYAEIIRSYIKLEPDDVVLDMGCGDGEITYRLSKFCKRIDGCDFSNRLIDKAKKHFTIISFFVQDILSTKSINTDIKYNKVFSYQVVQHIRPLEIPMLFNFICSVLSAGGKVFLMDVPDRKTAFIYYISKRKWVIPKLKGFIAFILTCLKLNRYIYRWDYSCWHSFRMIESVARKYGFSSVVYDKSECYYRMHITLGK